MATITMTSNKSSITPTYWTSGGVEMISLRLGDYVGSMILTKTEARELALNILATCQQSDKEAA